MLLREDGHTKMSDWYRLEGCVICGRIFLGFRDEAAVGREQEGEDRPKLVGPLSIFPRVCDECNGVEKK